MQYANPSSAMIRVASTFDLEFIMNYFHQVKTLLTEPFTSPDGSSCLRIVIVPSHRLFRGLLRYVRLLQYEKIEDFHQGPMRSDLSEG